MSAVIDERRVPRFRAISVSLLEAAARVRNLLIDAARIRRNLSEGWRQWVRQQYEAGAAAQPVFSSLLQRADELSALIEGRRRFFGVAIEWENEWDFDDDLFAIVKKSAGREGSGLVGKKSGAGATQRTAIKWASP